MVYCLVDFSIDVCFLMDGPCLFLRTSNLLIFEDVDFSWMDISQPKTLEHKISGFTMVGGWCSQPQELLEYAKNTQGLVQLRASYVAWNRLRDVK